MGTQSMRNGPKALVEGSYGLIYDSYGFEIKSEHVELFQLYSPLWEDEETTRINDWTEFLLEMVQLFATSGSFDSLPGLTQTGLKSLLINLRSGASLSGPKQRLTELIEGGIPMEARGSVWKLLLDVNGRRVPGLYENLVRQGLGELADSKNVTAHDLDKRFRNISVKSSSSSEDKSDPASCWASSGRTWLAQIEKDLSRTFPGHEMMRGIAGRTALRRLLAAYAMHNPGVGYCQGLNYIGGTLLLLVGEEDAFWLLDALVRDILAGYYSVNMTAAQIDQRVFRALLSEHFPLLSGRLAAAGADVSPLFIRWALCAFVNFLPLPIALRVWDLMLWERSTAPLFRAALALFEVYGPALAQVADALDAFEVVQELPGITFNGNRLISVANARFGDLDINAIRPLREEAEAEMQREAAEHLPTDDRPASPVPEQGKFLAVRKLFAKIESRVNGSLANDQLPSVPFPASIEPGTATVVQSPLSDGLAGFTAPGTTAARGIVNSPLPPSTPPLGPCSEPTSSSTSSNVSRLSYPMPIASSSSPQQSTIPILISRQVTSVDDYEIAVSSPFGSLGSGGVVVDLDMGTNPRSLLATSSDPLSTPLSVHQARPSGLAGTSVSAESDDPLRGTTPEPGALGSEAAGPSELESFGSDPARSRSQSAANGRSTPIRRDKAFQTANACHVLAFAIAATPGSGPVDIEALARTVAVNEQASACEESEVYEERPAPVDTRTFSNERDDWVDVRVTPGPMQTLVYEPAGIEERAGSGAETSCTSSEHADEGCSSGRRAELTPDNELLDNLAKVLGVKALLEQWEELKARLVSYQQHRSATRDVLAALGAETAALMEEDPALSFAEDLSRGTPSPPPLYHPLAECPSDRISERMGSGPRGTLSHLTVVAHPLLEESISPMQVPAGGRESADSLLASFEGLTNRMAGCLRELVGTVAERELMVGAVSNKLAKVVEELAEQDDELAGKTDEVAELRRLVGHSSRVKVPSADFSAALREEGSSGSEPAQPADSNRWKRLFKFT